MNLKTLKIETRAQKNIRQTTSLFILIISVSWASAGVSKQTVVLEPQQQASHGIEAIQGFEDGGYGGEYDGHDIGSEGGQSSGAELTSLAHSSAQQAKNAVQNQQTAGSQAAFGISSSFASAALGAAQTAQAALVGKQAIVQNLRRQLQEAQRLLQGEIHQYQQTEASALAAAQASQQAQTQLSTLTAALAAVQGGAQHAQQAASEAANAAAAQQSMVVEAKQRVARILGQLHNALEGLQETELSALRAAEAAQQAQSNAASAGAAVAAAGSKGGHSQVSGGGYHY